MVLYRVQIHYMWCLRKNNADMDGKIIKLFVGHILIHVIYDETCLVREMMHMFDGYYWQQILTNKKLSY